jgi:hypothetical protein
MLAKGSHRICIKRPLKTPDSRDKLSARGGFSVDNFQASNRKVLRMEYNKYNMQSMSRITPQWPIFSWAYLYSAEGFPPPLMISSSLSSSG